MYSYTETASLHIVGKCLLKRHDGLFTQNDGNEFAEMLIAVGLKSRFVVVER